MTFRKLNLFKEPLGSVYVSIECQLSATGPGQHLSPPPAKENTESVSDNAVDNGYFVACR
jgi:hypothetical protein